jgi:hypothetical protein
MLEDEVLEWKFKRGSDEALTEIYEKYLGPMLTKTCLCPSPSPAGTYRREAA